MTGGADENVQSSPVWVCRCALHTATRGCGRNQAGGGKADAAAQLAHRRRAQELRSGAVVWQVIARGGGTRTSPGSEDPDGPRPGGGAVKHARVRDRPAPPFCSSPQKREPSNCCSRKRTIEPSITSATNSMAILRGAPVWRGAKDGQQLLQCDGSAAVLR